MGLGEEKRGSWKAEKDFGEWVGMVFMYGCWVWEDGAISEKSDKINFFPLHNFLGGLTKI